MTPSSVHEIGHSIVGEVYGISVRYAELFPRATYPEAAGITRFRANAYQTAPPRVKALIAIAGPALQEEAGHSPVWGLDDTDDLALFKAASPDGSGSYVVRAAMDAAKRVCGFYDWRTAAQALAERGRLSGSEIRELAGLPAREEDEDSEPTGRRSASSTPSPSSASSTPVPRRPLPTTHPKWNKALSVASTMVAMVDGDVLGENRFELSDYGIARTLGFEPRPETVQALATAFKTPLQRQVAEASAESWAGLRQEHIALVAAEVLAGDEQGVPLHQMKADDILWRHGLELPA